MFLDKCTRKTLENKLQEYFYSGVPGAWHEAVDQVLSHFQESELIINLLLCRYKRLVTSKQICYDLQITKTKYHDSINDIMAYFGLVCAYKGLI